MKLLPKVIFGCRKFICLSGLAVVLSSSRAMAQPVLVSMVLDTNKVAVGQSTVLHVYAEIATDVKPATSQVFSWYVDFLNTDATVATANYASLLRPASDNDPRISSSGVTDGANRRGIYDTFLNLPGAGHDGPVEILSVPVTGVAPGTVTFNVAPGTGVPDLTSDFLVAPEGGGDPLFGGDYSAASADLEVVSAAIHQVSLQITLVSGAAGQTQVNIQFPTQANADQFVEYTTALGPGANWQSLPGAPHNSGTVTDTLSDPKRYYRLRIAAR